jgi:hypothetical protein
MLQSYSLAAAIYRIFLGMIGWCALVLQFFLARHVAETNGLTPAMATANFFSYYTILTNILVALQLTVVTLNPRSIIGVFFSKTSVQTALAANIVLVGLVYNLILARLWNPQGWSWVADFLLHTAVPLLYLTYWVLFVPKGTLPWTAPLPWLLYPLAYIVYSFFRGSETGWYPYPFVDVTLLGYAAVFRNCLGLVGVFVVLFYGFTWLDRLLGRKPIK